MEMTTQSWLVVIVDAAAAIAYFGLRMHSQSLLGVGVVFLVAGLLVAGTLPFQFPSATACGYALGFITSVLGYLALLRAYVNLPPRSSEEM